MFRLELQIQAMPIPGAPNNVAGIAVSFNGLAPITDMIQMDDDTDEDNAITAAEYGAMLGFGKFFADVLAEWKMELSVVPQEEQENPMIIARQVLETMQDAAALYISEVFERDTHYEPKPKEDTDWKAVFRELAEGAGPSKGEGNADME